MRAKNPAYFVGMMPKRDDTVAERNHRKTMLAAAFRIFGKLGFSEGVAGHITARDPEFTDTFWVNPFGVSFNRIKVSDLIRVDEEGKIVEGKHTLLNQAAFSIHSRLHHARPDVVAAAHAHSIYGKSWSTMGRVLEPLTQDACAFYDDHAIYNDYTGVVLDSSEGDRIAEALGDRKAAILKNHGNLTTGGSVEEAAWWFITMERCCQAQILVESMKGHPQLIDTKVALNTRNNEVGFPIAGWFSFQPLLQDIMVNCPDLVN
ncbi:MAG: ribulose-5-phosphate 4-epimerase/fuculose-1-phosphate aldolase [Paraglaciecola sp.]|jgi:ribulose-5-phosphate 4-epimerase/fuculose-1-phosphate aldolase